MDELQTVHHKILWEWKLLEVYWDDAIVYFKKRVPINQIFLNRESMLLNWKQETIDFIEWYKNKLK